MLAKRDVHEASLPQGLASSKVLRSSSVASIGGLATATASELGANELQTVLAGDARDGPRGEKLTGKERELLRVMGKLLLVNSRAIAGLEACTFVTIIHFYKVDGAVNIVPSQAVADRTAFQERVKGKETC